MVKTEPVVPVLDARAICGETPQWAAAAKVLYWIDAGAKKVCCFDPRTRENRVWELPGDVGSIGLRAGSGLVAAMKSGFNFIHLPEGRVEPIVNPEAALPDNTFNDGKVDPWGRFWAGSAWADFDNPPTSPTGSLYRLDADRTCHWIVGGIVETNTIAWSPDGRTMYYGSAGTDGTIFAADFDGASGTIAGSRVFARTLGHGVHDGSAMDSEGYLWTCFWQGSRIVRYAPDGRIDRTVPMPASYVTCCTFGDDDLETLYITTGRWTLTAEQLAKEPQAGAIFALRTGVRGLPENKYAG